MITPKKITQAVAGSWIENRYATMCAFSHGNRYLELTHQDHLELYEGEGQHLKRLPLPADAEPWWSRKDPHILYHRRDAELRELDVRTDKVVTLRRFSATSISGYGESDISDDGDHLVLADPKGQIWVYNLRTDQIIAGALWKEPFNALYLTPDNDVLVCAYTGVYLMSDGRKVAPSLAHNDVTRDVDGEPILIRFNGDDLPEGGCPNGIEKVNIRTGKRTCIWPLGWVSQALGGGPASYAGHISCGDNLPWCAVSLYSPYNAVPSRIYKAWLDGSRQELICDTGSLMIQEPDPTRPGHTRMAYNPTPRASVSRDGSRLVFNSNSGILDRGPNYTDVFMVKLEESAPVVEPPKPKPEPIVVQPSPDPNAELVKLRADLQTLREQQKADYDRAEEAEQKVTALEKAAATLKETLVRVEQQAEEQVATLTKSLTDLMKEVAEKPTPAPLTNGGLAEALKTISGLRAELLAEEHEAGLQHVRADEAAFKLAEALKQVELLVTALAAVHPIDPTVWRRINFLSPVNQAWRRWGHMVLPNGLLQMNDVDGQNWSPVSDETGDKYLLVRVDGGYEMYEATSNQK